MHFVYFGQYDNSKHRVIILDILLE